MNLYSYVINSPTNWIDPLGLGLEPFIPYDDGPELLVPPSVVISVGCDIIKGRKAAGGGVERLRTSQGWKKYNQTGGGTGSDGAGVSLQIGQVFGVENPEDYTGAFWDFQIAGFPFSNFAINIFGWGGVMGYKVGLYAGIPGWSFLIENYTLHDPCNEPS